MNAFAALRRPCAPAFQGFIGSATGGDSDGQGIEERYGLEARWALPETAQRSWNHGSAGKLAGRRVGGDAKTANMCS